MSHKITITIETGNAAFEHDEGNEIRRILEALSWRFANNPTTALDRAGIMDINGNPIGTVRVKPC